ncbi:zeta-sarcoglycan-like isoform X1 [Lingula anatina]|uniref:Zeta-sarcoglycan-like isoform X1 n=2 Tax=Lingula anatina TaxID=7574 RepID=A0A1S3IK31_LINAN|nr:zeta-sarcoglycan-like isoform X1 [Lingula anatina]|eukprot:XP_013398236.1 zeta-sarcoglycan-like isoform X1 [Lingula anatina]
MVTSTYSGNRGEREAMGRGRAAGNWSQTSSSPPPESVYKVGIYGWRKRCLYCFILVLLVLIIVNLSLTIWILKVMDFSGAGMGKLRITNQGIRVEGHSEFLAPLYAAQIKSNTDKALFLESSKNVTIHTRNEAGSITNRLYIGSKEVESYCDSFEVVNSAGEQLFYVDGTQVTIGPEKLHIAGKEGTVFQGSIQTGAVRSNISKSLTLESPTRELKLQGPQGITLSSLVGDVTMTTLQDVVLHSTGQAIRLNSQNIHMKNLQVSSPVGSGRAYPEVYQLCVCGNNGRLFLSEPTGECQATADVCT